MRAIAVRCAAQGALVIACAATPLSGQDSTTRHWYDRLTFRGYAQLRYNRLLETNEKLACSTCDRSIGEDGGFLLRRARLAITGEISDRVSVAIQPDFASEVGGRQNTLVLRHYYADIVLDQAKTLRARIGQSEVPVGFEALQSSSRRGPLDRADAIESLAPGEQDLGIFVFWTPPAARERFRRLATNQFKGTGDYGVVAVGVYNGQGGNRAEANDAPHVVARVTYPFLAGGTQFMELGAAAYAGTYTVTDAQRTSGVVGDPDIDDHRASASLVIYPQPLGLEAEWMVGRGPRYDASESAIIEGPQRGGYAMISYVIAGRGESRLTAYARAQYFTGAFKTEADARSSVVREYEPGIEWTIEPALELTAAYAIADRHYRDGEDPDNRQRGRFLRLQAQVSF
jgi:phosphate-selective porin